MADLAGAGGISGLFNNPLFLEMLGNAGQSISQGQGPAPGLNKTIQRQINAANTMQMLKKMLGPEDKATIGGDGSVNIKSSLDSFDTNLWGDKSLGAGSLRKGLEGTEEKSVVSDDMMKSIQSPDNVVAGAMGPSIGYLGNPSLAGLDSRDILGILAGVTNLESVRGKALANALKNEKPAMGLVHPELGQIDLDTWKTLPDDEKKYTIYYNAAVGRGEKPISRQAFSNLKDTEQVRTLKALKADKSLFDLDKELRKSGATTLSLPEQLDVKRKGKYLDALQQGKEDLASGAVMKEIDKNLSKDLEKRYDLTVNPEAKKQYTDKYRVNAIDQKITTQGGTIKDRVISSTSAGPVMTYYVEWPDGDETTFKLPLETK